MPEDGRPARSSGRLPALIAAGYAAQLTAWVKAHFTAKTVGGESECDLTSPAK